MDIIKKYVNYGLEHWGSDDKVCYNILVFYIAYYVGNKKNFFFH